MARNIGEIIWESGVDDGKYSVKVVREASHRGKLTLVEVASGVVLLDKEVGLSYGAMFGPDVSDIAEWQDMVMARIDEVEAQ